MSNQSKGAARERQFAERLRDQGWIVKGHGDAHGAGDLLAMRNGEGLLVQVKANRDGGPYMNFRPAERHKLRQDALAAGARAVLIWWPPDRQGARWLFSEAWPQG